MTNRRTQKGLMAQLPKRMAAARRDVEKVTRQALERAIELLPPAPRKQVKELRHRLERAGTELQHQMKRTRHDVEKRGERLVANVTERAEKALAPLVRRLDVPSRAEVDRLRKRITALEKRAEHPAKRAEHVATPVGLA
ncbi:MAG TPA: hypothetical protein VMW17_03940 [Candidatus Binatia bacterium]|nr:hypothetical protein [Candidatus Binatia bacterium]